MWLAPLSRCGDGLNNQGILVPFQVAATVYPIFQSFQTVCGANLTSNQWVARPLSPGADFLGCWAVYLVSSGFSVNTLRTGDANLRFYITTAQDGWRKSAFLTRACFPCTIHLTFRHCESCILGQAFNYSPENAFYIFNQQIYFIIWYLLDRASLI